MERTVVIAVTIVSLAISSFTQSKPKTVRDYFLALPDKYFSLDCCESVKPTRKAKERFLEKYLNVEDTTNGYLSAYGDAAQDGMVMALFKRPNGTYMIGFYDFGEGGVGDTPWTYFFDYTNGHWTDISRKLIKGYDKTKYIYELPRHGTTVTVYATDEMADGYRGKKLYDLIWKKGRFVRSL